MELDINEIMKILPHRPPLLLVDRIVEIEPFKSATGIKCITMNEPQFNGHFPGHPIVPGVLMVEMMAQAGCAAMLALPENKGKIGYFAGIDKAKFRRPVVPGDKLRIEVEIGSFSHSIGKGKGICTVNGEKAVEAEIKFAIK